MVGMVLVKSLYVLPTWTRAIALVAEHDALQAAVGCVGDVPSIDACYRFTRKLRQHKGLLDACIEAVIVSLKDGVARLRREHRHRRLRPSRLRQRTAVQIEGRQVAGAVFRPRRIVGHLSAISTRNGGGFYGFKIHAAVCTTSGLPVAWETHTAKDAEVPVVTDLLDVLKAHALPVSTLAMDRGYDASDLYAECESRGIRLIVPLRETPFVKP
jgi:hypothetical protein